MSHSLSNAAAATKKVCMFARWHVVGFLLLSLKWEMSQSLWNCKHQQISMFTKDVNTNFKKKNSIKKRRKSRKFKEKKGRTNCPCICKKEPRLSSYQKWQLYNIRTVLVLNDVHVCCTAAIVRQWNARPTEKCQISYCSLDRRRLFSQSFFFCLLFLQFYMLTIYTWYYTF